MEPDRSSLCGANLQRTIFILAMHTVDHAGAYEPRALEDGGHVANALNTAMSCHNKFEAGCGMRVSMPNAERTLGQGIK